MTEFVALFFFACVLGAGAYLAWRIWQYNENKKSLALWEKRDSQDLDTHAIENHDRDAWEGAFYDVSNPLPLKAHIHIAYQDRNGATSQREVMVRQFEENNPRGLIIGQCLMRNATRTFRFDRVSAATDCETGEIIDNLQAYLSSKYKSSPEYSLDVLFDDYLDTLKVLYFVARADGQFSKKEKAVVADYLNSLINAQPLEPVMLTTALIDAPTLSGFKSAFGRVLKAGSINPIKLIDACKEIVATQVKVHPAEQDALDYLDKRHSKFVKESAS